MSRLKVARNRLTSIRSVAVSVVVVTLIISSASIVWGQITEGGIVSGCLSNSGFIRGVDDETGGCRTGETPVSWYTAEGTEAAFLAIDGKALDADLLDGMDSAAFAGAVHDHDDSYYVLGSKVADSELLDGLDGTDFLRNGAAAGGALAGTYPNPSLGPNAVDTAAISDGAVTATKVDPSLLAALVTELAGQTCPTGQFVAGFDQSSRILCGAPSVAPQDGDGDGGIPAGISLTSVAQSIEDFLNGLAGSELDTTPRLFEGSGVSGAITPLGFAFCLPPDPTAPQSTTLPLYGCSPSVQAEVVTGSGETGSITVNTSHLYVDFAGEVTTLFGTVTFDGFALLTDVQATATASLIDAGGGMRTIGQVTDVTLTFSDSDIDTTSELIDFVDNVVFSLLRAQAIETLEGALNDVLANVPPFTP